MSELVIKGTERLYWDANRSIADLFWPSDPLEYPTAARGKTDNWTHSGGRIKSVALTPVGSKQGPLFRRPCFWDESRSDGGDNIFYMKLLENLCIEAVIWSQDVFFCVLFFFWWKITSWAVFGKASSNYSACFIDCFNGGKNA